MILTTWFLVYALLPISALSFISIFPPPQPITSPLYSSFVNGFEVGKDVKDAKWDEETMSGPLGPRADKLFLETFRRSLAASNLRTPESYPPGYDGMIEMGKPFVVFSLFTSPS